MSLSEYASFKLTAKDAAETALKDIYLDVYYLNNDARENVHTLRTSVRGEADAYVSVALSRVFYVGVGTQSASSYGIPAGYEPVLNVDGTEKNIAVSLGVPETFTVSVEDTAGLPVEGAQVALQYAAGDAAEGVAAAVGTTDATGSVSLTYTKHAGSSYEVAALSVPSAYVEADAVAVGEGNTSAQIVLSYAKHYATDVNHTASGTPAPAEGYTNREALPVEITELGMNQLRESEGKYYYGDAIAYLMLDVENDRIFAGKTIKELVTEPDSGLFTFEECTNESTNEWTRHNYYPLLKAYAEKVNGQGLYPIDAELYGFLQRAAANHLFAAADETADEKEIYLAVAYYSNMRLGLGEENAYVGLELPTASSSTYGTVKNLGLVSGIQAGYYKLTAKVTSADGNPSAIMGYTTSGLEGVQNVEYIFNLTAATDDASKFEGIIYLDGYAKDDYALRLINFDRTVACTVTLTLEAVANCTPYEKNLVTASEENITVYAVPESWLMLTGLSSSTGYKSNVSTFGYFYTQKHGYAQYTAEVQGSSLEGAKVYQFTMQSRSATSLLRTSSLTQANAMSSQLTNAWSSYSYGFVVTHTGDTLVQVQVKLSAVYTRANFVYEGGAGSEGSYVDTDKAFDSYTVLHNGDMRITKPGFVFDGWEYQDAAGETKVAHPGDSLVFTAEQLNAAGEIKFTVKWKPEDIYTVEGTLGLGAANKLSGVQIAGAEHTSFTVSLAPSLAGEYKLTATLNVETTDFYVTVDGVRSYFYKDTAASDADANKYVYVGYIEIAGVHEFTVYLEDALSAALTVDFELEAYVQPELDGSVETVVVAPTNPYNEEKDGKFKLKLADLDAGSYAFTVSTVGGHAIPSLALVAEGKDPVELTASYLGKTYYIDIEEGDTAVWLVASTDTTDYYSVVNFSMHRVYNITYEANHRDATGTPVNKLHNEEGATVTLGSRDMFTRENYLLAGWEYTAAGADSMTVLNVESSFVMPAADIVLKAHWQAENPFSRAVSVGNSTDCAIDPAQYTSFSISISNIRNATKSASGGYKLTFAVENTDFRGAIAMNGSLTGVKANLAYSEAESDGTTSKFIAYFRSENGMKTADTLTIDLLTYNGPTLSGTLTLQSAGIPSAATDGSKTTVGAGYSGLSNGHYIPFTLPNTVLLQHSYKMYVRSHAKVASLSVCSGKKIDTETGTAPALTELKEERKTEDDYTEFVFSFTSSYNYIAITAGSAGSCYDVWFELTDDSANFVGIDEPLEGVTLNTTAQKFKFSADILKTSVPGKEMEQYNLWLQVSESAEIVFVSNVDSGYTYESITLNAASRYKVYKLNLQRTATFTLKADKEVTVTIHVEKYSCVQLSKSEKAGESLHIEAGAEKAMELIDYDNYMETRFWIEGANEGDVFYFYHGSDKFTLDKSNNWTLPMFLCGGGTGARQCYIAAADGAEHDITIHYLDYTKIGQNETTSVTLQPDEATYIALSSDIQGEYAPYVFTITPTGEVGDNVKFIIHYNDDETAEFTKSGEVFTTAPLALNKNYFYITSQTDEAVAFSFSGAMKNDVAFGKDMTAGSAVTLSSAGEKYASVYLNPLALVSFHAEAASGEELDLSSLTLTFTSGDTDTFPASIVIDGFTKDAGEGKSYSATKEIAAVGTSAAAVHRFKLTVSGVSEDVKVYMTYIPVTALTMAQLISGFQVHFNEGGTTPPTAWYKLPDEVLAKNAGGKTFTITMPYDIGWKNMPGTDHKDGELCGTVKVGENRWEFKTKGQKYEQVTFGSEYLTVDMTGCISGMGSMPGFAGTIVDHFVRLTINEYLGFGVGSPVTTTMKTGVKAALELKGVTIGKLYTIKAEVSGNEGSDPTFSFTGSNSATSVLLATITLNKDNEYKSKAFAFYNINKTLDVTMSNTTSCDVTFTLEEYKGEALTLGGDGINVSIKGTTERVFLPIDSSLIGQTVYCKITATPISVPSGSPQFAFGDAKGPKGSATFGALGQTFTFSGNSRKIESSLLKLTLTDGNAFLMINLANYYGNETVSATIKLENPDESTALKLDAPMTYSGVSKTAKTAIFDSSLARGAENKYLLSATTTSSSFTTLNIGGGITKAEGGAVSLTGSKPYEIVILSETDRSFTLAYGGSSGSSTYTLTLQKYTEALEKSLTLDGGDVSITVPAAGIIIVKLDEAVQIGKSDEGKDTSVYSFCDLVATLAPELKETATLYVWSYGKQYTLNKDNNFSLPIAFQSREFVLYQPAATDPENGNAPIDINLKLTTHAGQKIQPGVAFTFKPEHYVQYDFELEGFKVTNGRYAYYDIVITFSSLTNQQSNVSLPSGLFSTQSGNSGCTVSDEGRTHTWTKKSLSSNIVSFKFWLFGAPADETVTITMTPTA